VFLRTHNTKALSLAEQLALISTEAPSPGTTREGTPHSLLQGAA